MTKTRPPKLQRDPPWMRLGPAGDDPEEGGNGERLWRKLAEGVTPLAKTRHGRQAPPAPSLPSPLEGEVPTRTAQVRGSGGGGGTPKQGTGGESPHPTLPLKGGGKPSPKPPPPLTPGKFAGLDRNSGEKLRKGKMPVDAKLDLHGMTQAQAHGAVTRFIAAQHAAGARCVLVVTGKGGKSGEAFAPKSTPVRFTMTAGRGILKEALPRWLNEPGMRARIVAASPARRDHGGEGAMYVLLKRKR